MKEKPIEVGSVVAFSEGYYKVSALWTRKGTANLKSIFGSTIHHKGVPITSLREAEEEWYEKWTQSETYKCM
jgi:hypothetical protein